MSLKARWHVCKHRFASKCKLLAPILQQQPLHRALHAVHLPYLIAMQASYGCSDKDLIRTLVLHLNPIIQTPCLSPTPTLHTQTRSPSMSEPLLRRHQGCYKNAPERRTSCEAFQVSVTLNPKAFATRNSVGRPEPSKNRSPCFHGTRTATPG